jgi:hypothetical protein
MGLHRYYLLSPSPPFRKPKNFSGHASHFGNGKNPDSHLYLQNASAVRFRCGFLNVTIILPEPEEEVNIMVA